MQTTDLLIRNYKSLLTHSNCDLACNTRLCYMPIYNCTSPTLLSELAA